MTTQVPPLPESWREGWLAGWLEPGPGGARLTDQGAAGIASLGLIFFLVGTIHRRRHPADVRGPQGARRSTA